MAIIAYWQYRVKESLIGSVSEKELEFKSKLLKRDADNNIRHFPDARSFLSVALPSKNMSLRGKNDGIRQRFRIPG
jgi:hypothetical protein